MGPGTAAETPEHWLQRLHNYGLLTGTMDLALDKKTRLVTKMVLTSFVSCTVTFDTVRTLELWFSHCAIHCLVILITTTIRLQHSLGLVVKLLTAKALDHKGYIWLNVILGITEANMIRKSEKREYQIYKPTLLMTPCVLEVTLDVRWDIMTFFNRAAFYISNINNKLLNVADKPIWSIRQCPTEKSKNKTQIY